ncbi:MAG: hypothetical protein IPO23_13920 [Flavobacterium sp.]|nr:hypothetical protein [Flavobacterium sp.]
MKKIIMILTFVSLMVSCKNTDKQVVVENDVRQATIDSMKAVAEKQRIIDSMTIVNQNVQKQKEVVVVHDNQPCNSTPQRKNGVELTKSCNWCWSWCYNRCCHQQEKKR